VTEDVHQRLDLQEAACLALLDRVERLERTLEFEIRQREAMEAIIVKLTRLPLRVDRLEVLAKSGGRR